MNIVHIIVIICNFHLQCRLHYLVLKVTVCVSIVHSNIQNMHQGDYGLEQETMNEVIGQQYVALLVKLASCAIVQ